MLWGAGSGLQVVMGRGAVLGGGLPALVEDVWHYPQALKRLRMAKRFIHSQLGP